MDEAAENHIKDYIKESGIDFNKVFYALYDNHDDKSEKIKSMEEKYGGKDGFHAFYVKEAKKHPISSFIRAMEIRCRDFSPQIFSKSFNIRYESNSESNAKSGSSGFENDFSAFNIFLPYGDYNNDKYENEVRNIIAHEMGHLYCLITICLEKAKKRIEKKELENGKEYRKEEKIIELRKILNQYIKKEKEQSEIDANLIALFILNERSKFHNSNNKRAGNFKKNSIQILDGLKDLKNKKK